MIRSPNRRAFLRAVGASFATLPFFRLVENSFAQSMGEALPLKFAGMYHPHGVAAEHWVMRGTDSETAFDLKYENCSLAPFDDAATYGKSFKNKILVLEGVDLMSSANGHSTAGTILTGSRIDGDKPQNSSLDQYLAVEKGLGAGTRIGSVALAIGTDALSSGESLSFGPGGQPLAKIIDPVAAFDQLFAGFVATDDPAAVARAARERKLGQSVLDYVRSDVQRLSQRLAAEEKQKLEQHLTSLREIEKQFAEPKNTCAVPTRPDAAQFPKIKRYNQGEPYFDVITNAMIDLMAQAFACDITRFATLYLADLSYVGNPLGLPEDNHAGVAHTYNASTVGNNGHAAPGMAATWLPLAKFNHYSYGKVARFMQKLDALGVLDSTLIYCSSDMGNPALHSTMNVPTLIAGGANGKFRMGRRLKLKPDCPPTNEWCENTPDYAPTANSKILVSIAQAFGVPTDSFGTQPDPKLTTGALTELA